MGLSALVLAGGRTGSTGKPRALLPFKERPLVAWTVEAMSEFADEVLVVTVHGWVEELKRRFPGGARVIEDEYVGIGPLGGLHAGSRAARHAWLAAAPSEAPLTKPALYRLLMEKAKGREGAVPTLSRSRMHLHAVYRRRALIARIEKALARGETELPRALRGMRLARVGARRIDTVDKERRSFLMLRSLDEIKAAERGL